jgi:hypothetical protein
MIGTFIIHQCSLRRKIGHSNTVERHDLEMFLATQSPAMLLQLARSTSHHLVTCRGVGVRGSAVDHFGIGWAAEADSQGNPWARHHEPAAGKHKALLKFLVLKPITNHSLIVAYSRNGSGNYPSCCQSDFASRAGLARLL